MKINTKTKCNDCIHSDICKYRTDTNEFLTVLTSNNVNRFLNIDVTCTVYEAKKSE